MQLTLLSHDVATKKFALGLNFKQLILSEGGWLTSISLFGLVAVVVFEPNKNPLLFVLLLPNIFLELRKSSKNHKLILEKIKIIT